MDKVSPREDCALASEGAEVNCFDRLIRQVEPKNRFSLLLLERQNQRGAAERPRAAQPFMDSSGWAEAALDRAPSAIIGESEC